jgi:hypothetical protein
MGLARHNFTGRRKFCGHLGSKFFILRAASPAARSLEVRIRGLPDIKSPPSSFINSFNPQKSHSSQEFFRRYAGQFASVQESAGMQIERCVISTFGRREDELREGKASSSGRSTCCGSEIESYGAAKGRESELDSVSNSSMNTGGPPHRCG